MTDPTTDPGEHVDTDDLSDGAADEDQSDLAAEDTAPQD